MRTKIEWVCGTLLLFVLISSCASVSKSRSSAIHELSANYNVLFHGEESLDQALIALDSKEEDYNRPLSFIAQSLSSGARDSSVYDFFERAETKAVKAIQKHSVNLNNVEYNKHISRAYSLLGMARLLSGSIFEALEAFERAKTLAISREDLSKANWGIALSRYHLGELESSLRALKALENIDGSKDLSPNIKLLALELTRKLEIDSLESLLDQMASKRQLVGVSMRSVYALAQQYEILGSTSKAQRLYAFLSKKRGYSKARFRVLAQLRLAELSAQDSTDYFERLFQVEKRWNNYDHRYYVDHDRGRWYLNQSRVEPDQYRAKQLDSMAVASFMRSNRLATENLRAINYDHLAQHFFFEKNYALAFAYYDTLLSGFSAEKLRHPVASKERHQKLKGYLELAADLKVVDSILNTKPLVLPADQDEILMRMPSKISEAGRSKAKSSRRMHLEQKTDLSFQAASLLVYNFSDAAGAISLLTPLLDSEFATQTRATALFRLYQISVLHDQTKEAETYKSTLLKEHPNSIYILHLDGTNKQNSSLEASLAQLYAEGKEQDAYTVVETAFAQRQPLGPESLLIVARIEARLFGIERYANRLTEIKQVFRNTWAERETSRLLDQVAEAENQVGSSNNRYGLVFSADKETLQKLRAISAQKLSEQNYDLSAVIEPFDQYSSLLVVGWFYSETYAEDFYKRNAFALKETPFRIISQDKYLSAQWTKSPLF